MSFVLGENSFSCGSLDHDTMQLLEAFQYALQKVSSDSILSGVQLGGIAFDSCSSASLAGNRITNFQSGVVHAVDEGLEITPSSVKLYIGGDSKDSAMREAMVLNEYHLPLIGYGSKASALSDMDKFPLFARTMINQEAEIKFAIMILKQLGISYVQQVYEDTEEGHSFAYQFKMHAAKEHICVAASNAITMNVADVLLENPAAHVIITWAEVESLNNLLQYMTESDSYNEFTFIGGAGWGGGLDTSDSRAKDVLQGALSWTYEMPTLTDYVMYLRNIDVRQYTSNPWFSQWYQQTFHCYLDPASKGGYTQQCASTAIPDASGFQVNNAAVFVINAVLTAAHAMDKTLKYFCGDQYNSVCAEYETAKNKSKVFMQMVYDTSFMDDAMLNVLMVDGSGAWPLNVYNVVDLQYNYVST